MSFINYIMTLTKKGIKKFVGIVTLANRSYHMHDYHSDTTTGNYQGYRVGENNQGGQGDQNKLFISKSTLILCTEDVYIKLNHSDNVVQTLLADNFYEFKSDIRIIMYAYVDIAGTIYIWCEGVLAQEGRVSH